MLTSPVPIAVMFAVRELVEVFSLYVTLIVVPSVLVAVSQLASSLTLHPTLVLTVNVADPAVEPTLLLSGETSM